MPEANPHLFQSLAPPALTTNSLLCLDPAPSPSPLSPSSPLSGGYSPYGFLLILPRWGPVLGGRHTGWDREPTFTLYKDGPQLTVFETHQPHGRPVIKASSLYKCFLPQCRKPASQFVCIVHRSFFFGRTCSIQKFTSRRWIPSRICDLLLSWSHTRPFACCATVGTPCTVHLKPVCKLICY